MISVPGIRLGSTSATIGAASMPDAESDRRLQCTRPARSRARDDRELCHPLTPTATATPSSSGRRGWWHSATWPVDLRVDGARAARCVAQMSVAFQQRVRNRQPDGGFSGDGTSPLSRIRCLAMRGVQLRRRRHQGRGVRVVGPVENGFGRARLRRSGPRYITATRSATCRTTDRSWRDEDVARCRSCCCRSLSRLSTCACTDRSSADTGSSQMIDVGVQRQRAGDADALTLTAGELLRVLVGGLGAEPDQVEQSAHPHVAVAARLVHAPCGCATARR